MRWHTYHEVDEPIFIELLCKRSITFSRLIQRVVTGGTKYHHLKYNLVLVLRSASATRLEEGSNRTHPREKKTLKTDAFG